jgi:uncharacterized membrane protein
MFLGGWPSFNGEIGKGGWGRTMLKEILPVECIDIEDLRETTEGYHMQPTAKDHPILKGLDISTIPPILGYNITKPKPGCDVVITWKEHGDPALAVGQFGKGRVLAYTSDPAPHWACNFVYWDDYAKFWQNCATWALGGK